MDAGSHSHVQLSEQQRRQFKRDGYLCPIRVLDDREVERYFNSYMEYSAANKARLDALPANQKYKVLSETHFVLPWVYEIVTHPRVLDAVEGLLGTEPDRLEQQLVHQNAGRKIVRQLASGRNLLETESADGGHRLGGAVASTRATAACA